MSKNEITLIKYAVEDFRTYASKNRALRLAIFKKLLFLEASPMQAGRPLTGPLSEMRKISVGDRIWRIVWKAINKNESQVWGIGKRDHSDIYREVERRIKILGANPETATIAEMLSALQLRVQPVLLRDDIPQHILDALYHEMKLSIETIETLNVEEAKSLFERYLAKGFKNN